MIIAGPCSGPGVEQMALKEIMPSTKSKIFTKKKFFALKSYYNVLKVVLAI